MDRASPRTLVDVKRTLLALALGGTLFAAPGAVQAAPLASPTAGARHVQVVTVKVEHPWSTTGVLETWKWSPRIGDYRRVLGPVTAYVGADGVGKASEYVSRTPAGIYTLTEAFGRNIDPGTALPYKQVGYSDWWVSDVNSPKYNTVQTCSPGDWCGFDQGSSEQLGAISVYSYAVVIDYNRNHPVAGRGSGFFLHVTNYRPTAGCVSIEQSKLVNVLRWLKPARHPTISIGVGNAAYAGIGR